MSVGIRRTGDVLELRIERPDQGNRLDAETVAILTRELVAISPHRGGPAVVVLSAAGPDFSLGRQRPAEESADPLAIVEEFEGIQVLNEALRTCGAVTVAAVRGRAEGAGLSLAGRADIVVVADDARLSFPEIPHGIPPTIVLSHYRYVLPLNLIGDLIFTGREFAGRDAVAFGIAARSVPDDRLDDEVHDIAERIAGYDRASLAVVKRYMLETRDLLPAAAPRLGISVYANEMGHRFGRRLTGG